MTIDVLICSADGTQRLEHMEVPEGHCDPNPLPEPAT